jgi:hypothetical protein
MRKYIYLLILLFIISCKEKEECYITGFIYSQGKPIPNIEFGYSLIHDPIHSSEFRIGKTDSLGMFKVSISSTDDDNIIYFGNPKSMLATRKFICEDANKIDYIYKTLVYLI